MESESRDSSAVRTTVALEGPGTGFAVPASERTRLLYVNAHGGQLTSVGVGLLTLLVFQPQALSASLLWWFVILVAVSLARTVVHIRFHRADPKPAEMSRWHRRFLFGVSATGALLGNVWWLVGGTATVEQQLLLAFILGGMSIGAIHLLGASFLVYAIYLTLLCWPGMFWFVFQGGEFHLAVAALILVFYLAMLFTARGHYRTLSRLSVLTSANRNLAEQQVRLADFARLGSDLFWETDEAGRFTYVSAGFGALTSIPAGDLLGKAVGTDGIPPLLPAGFIPEVIAGARPGEMQDHSFEWMLPSGRKAVLSSNAVTITATPGGQIVGIRGTLSDITRQHELSQRLRHQATHDDLTELVNRREFERRLETLLDSATSGGATHAVCYLDLDQFKDVNDNCGHAAGDALLQRVAADLRVRLRSRDTLARLGGDEFGVLLEHCGRDDAAALAESLRTAIAGLRFEWEGQVFSVTASVGLVFIEGHTTDLAAVMLAADAACYAAKDAGRDCVVQAARDAA